jgi:hypothetical protein
LREPDGEPRVKRTGSPIADRRDRRSANERESREREPRRGGLVVSDRDVPEFIPNF